jgi:putative hydrolase of the HAD superfamily
VGRALGRTRRADRLTPRAVVFDLYGTLVDEPAVEASAQLVRELADTLGVDREEFAHGWRDTYELRATGPWEASIRAILHSMGGSWDGGRYDAARRVRRAFVERELEPRADAEPTLLELRRRGFRLGLMTECGDDVPRLWPSSPLARHFDAQVYTCEVGKRKPAPELYELIVERLGVEPARCTYVGDGGGYELAGAARLGMRPILLLAPYSEWLHPEAREWSGERVDSLTELLAVL